MWGWTFFLGRDQNVGRVNPTHMGMDRSKTPQTPIPICKPHMYGDGPKYPDLPKELFQQTPRAWGWTELNAVDSLAGGGKLYIRGDGP